MILAVANIKPRQRAMLPDGHLDVNPRCRRCGRMLARFLARPYLVDCPRCGESNAAKDPPKKDS